MHIVLGESDLQDGIDIAAEQLRLRVEEGRLIPRTEPPSEEEFIAVYSRLYEAGAEHVISIHLSEKISDAVKVARRTSAYMKDFSVTVIDAGTISAGAALMAFAGAGMITAGGSIEQVLAEVEAVKKKRSECVVVCSLEKIMGKEKDNTMLQMMLDYKPMLVLENDNLVLHGKPKTDNEIEDKLVAFCREKRTLSYMVVLHANKPVAAAALLTRLEKLFPQVPSIIFPYSAVQVANLGNELLGVAIS
jgi:DegV family protein with EDD domain